MFSSLPLLRFPLRYPLEDFAGHRLALLKLGLREFAFGFITPLTSRIVTGCRCDAKPCIRCDVVFNPASFSLRPSNCGQ
ncbi:MAG: hypothetical protein QF473_31135 [Planctomycetota bacterium]|jgi:hypothetical protein|nr:hypothetical protein [Planctomycetota bacterium]